MKNGIYLTLILFLGIMGYFVVNSLYIEGNIALSGVIFFVVSSLIYILTTHFTKKVELIPIQKIINVIYISILAIYGIFLGSSMMYSSSYELTSVGFESYLFLLASFLLFFGLYKFVKKHTYHGHFF